MQTILPIVLQETFQTASSQYAAPSSSSFMNHIHESYIKICPFTHSATMQVIWIAVDKSHFWPPPALKKKRTLKNYWNKEIPVATVVEPKTIKI